MGSQILAVIAVSQNFSRLSRDGGAVETPKRVPHQQHTATGQALRRAATIFQTMPEFELWERHMLR